MALNKYLAGALLAVALALPVAAQAAAEPRNMTQAQVNETLRGNPDLLSGLYLAAQVYEIARRCETLRGPNKLARTAYFLGLYNQARRLGFSRAQIEAFVEDQAERARMDAMVRAYVEARGARLDDPASMCALGRAEMAARTPVGQRLSER